MLTGNSLNSTSQAAAEISQLFEEDCAPEFPNFRVIDFWAVDNSQISALFPYHGLLGHNPCYGTVFESVTGLVISDGGWCLSKVRCGVFPFGRTASVLLGTCSPGLGMVFTR